MTWVMLNLVVIWAADFEDDITADIGGDESASGEEDSPLGREERA